jgi:hypothetical protein
MLLINGSRVYGLKKSNNYAIFNFLELFNYNYRYFGHLNKIQIIDYQGAKNQSNDFAKIFDKRSGDRP